MAKIADLTVIGKSGSKYTFAVYSIDSTWKELAAVYVITKRTEKTGGGGSHRYVYVGETENLKDRHSNHHKADCFAKHDANCLCALLEDDEDKRLEIELDILAGNTFPCND
jgi:hypothetical protein